MPAKREECPPLHLGKMAVFIGSCAFGLIVLGDAVWFYFVILGIIANLLGLLMGGLSFGQTEKQHVPYHRHWCIAGCVVNAVLLPCALFGPGWLDV